MWKKIDKSNEKIYHRVRMAEVSCNCEFTAEDYFKLIAPLCPDNKDIAHSLLRLAMRMIFYLDIVSIDDMIAYIEYINKGRPTFLKWLYDNKELVALIIKELTICLFFYDLKYDEQKNIVVLDHKVDEIMAFAFTDIKDRNIYKEFSSFDDFKTYFRSFFSVYDIAESEIDKLILEEKYKERFFPNNHI